MNFDTFNALPRPHVAEIVRQDGPHVLVFPINGTRRWFHLENIDKGASFLDRILDRYIALFRLLFSHGIHTLLTPVLGPDIAARGEAYLEMVHAALQELTGARRFLDFYARANVRVRFYGDYEPFLEAQLPDIPERIDAVESHTAGNSGHRLFWGMFAHDALETVAQLSVRHHRATGQIPGREEIVAAYYGEPVPPADLYLGMLPPRVFDFPLLDTGSTALYFMKAPSPCLEQSLLRRVLFDYLYNRPADHRYESLSGETWQHLREIYRSPDGDLVGAGRLIGGGRIWIPA